MIISCTLFTYLGEHVYSILTDATATDVWVGLEYHNATWSWNDGSGPPAEGQWYTGLMTDQPDGDGLYDVGNEGQARCSVFSIVTGKLWDTFCMELHHYLCQIKT